MITFINVFTVLPEKQQDAFQAISKVYTEVVRHQPGFISAKLLISHDRTRVTAIAEWESVEHLQAMRRLPGFQELHDREFYDAIISPDPHTYSVALELEAQSDRE